MTLGLVLGDFSTGRCPSLNSQPRKVSEWHCVLGDFSTKVSESELPTPEGIGMVLCPNVISVPEGIRVCVRMLNLHYVYEDPVPVYNYEVSSRRYMYTLLLMLASLTLLSSL